MRLVRELAARDLTGTLGATDALADDELLVVTFGAATTTSSLTTVSTVLAKSR